MPSSWSSGIKILKSRSSEARLVGKPLVGEREKSAWCCPIHPPRPHHCQPPDRIPNAPKSFLHLILQGTLQHREGYWVCLYQSYISPILVIYQAYIRQISVTYQFYISLISVIYQSTSAIPLVTRGSKSIRPRLSLQTPASNNRVNLLDQPKFTRERGEPSDCQ